MSYYPQNDISYLYRYKNFSNNKIISKFLNEFDTPKIRHKNYKSEVKFDNFGKSSPSGLSKEYWNIISGFKPGK